MRLSEEQTRALVAWGAQHLNRFNDVLDEYDEFRHMSNKQMVVVATCFAAGLAASTKLDLEEFLAFATIAYQNLILEPKEDAPVDSRVQEAGDLRRRDEPSGAGLPVGAEPRPSPDGVGNGLEDEQKARNEVGNPGSGIPNG